MARIAIYLTGPEYDWIELQAGEAPLSKWCRRRLLQGQKIAGAEISCIPVLPPTSAHNSKKTCKHGTEKGTACWQCGGIAHVTDRNVPD